MVKFGVISDLKKKVPVVISSTVSSIKGIHGYQWHYCTHVITVRLTRLCVTVRLFHHPSSIDVQKLQQTGHRTGTISEVVVGAKIWGARSTASSVWRRSWRAESVATVVPDVVCSRLRLGVSKGGRHNVTLDWNQNCAIPVQLR